MVLEGLGKSLRGVVEHISNSSTIDENLIKDVTRELQRALLQADVNVQLVLELTNKIQERALNEEPPAGKSPKDFVINIIYKELVNLLDNGDGLAIKPQTIMMVGLYGQGKTTTTGKLANYFIKKGFTVGLIGADVYRPAALDQLKQLGEKVNADVYGEPGEKNASKIVKNGLTKFSDKKIIIIDTSGRHALENDLIQEIKDIANIAKPDERILVLDSQVGQQAGPQAEAFHNAVGVTGVILTKMDGTARGGGALSAIAKTNARIVFLGTGEHIRDLEAFNADRFISRLLGMGDLASLMQIAKEEIGEDDALEQVARNMLSGRFTLSDMYQQMAAVTKMGPLQKVMSMIPGMNKMEDKIDYEASQKKLAKYRVIMDSMTQYEKDEPNSIKGKRIDRIAQGSGVAGHDVRELLKQYNQSKKMMGSIGKDRKMRKQMMKQFGGMDMEGLQDLQNGNDNQ
ncbi:MAG: signal recognition particle protein Srp54 [Candidatus Methanomethylophilaceae archaeon]|nr:signal recognition particle protein Srp54 [Candidatus Methanomethylophilaceae archaeon]MDD3378553.1 signal recognition particle protein Srp54 [Candidatus Methanomethylophilaceae archaeon]MDY0224470.1 signal recognition particle protein Srp54 [Candidatus Methanomethylophilaceae archaeon]